MTSCGNPVAADGEALMPARPKLDKATSCIRCKTSRGNLVIRHAVYCKECFFPLVTHKFRKALDPHISPTSSISRDTSKVKASGDVLLGFSGGLGSSVALDVFRRVYFAKPGDDTDERDAKAKERIEKKGSKAPKRRRCWGKAYVGYVETCGAYVDGQAEDRSEAIKRHVEALFEDAYFVSAKLEDAFDERWWSRVTGLQEDVSTIMTRIQLVDEGLPFSTTPSSSPSSPSSSTPTSDARTLLRSYLCSLPTPTAVQSAITTLTRLILLYTAHHLRCSHLLLGTSLTSHSIGVINSIAQGGGAHILEEAYEEWSPPQRMAERLQADNEEVRVRVVRPLRDVGMKECAAWAYWKGLRVPGKRSHVSGSAPAKSTIGGLTKNFIVGLEKDYPSTVSTIARTTAKLTPKNEVEGRCIMCQRPKPVGVLDWKSRISIRTLPHAKLSPALLTQELEEVATTTPSLETPQLASELCYACHTTLTSRTPRSVAPSSEGVVFPVWVNSSLPRISGIRNGITADEVEGELMATRRMGRVAMKEAIGDFLLET